jgi:hypothetical protein
MSTDVWWSIKIDDRTYQVSESYKIRGWRSIDGVIYLVELETEIIDSVPCVTIKGEFYTVPYLLFVAQITHILGDIDNEKT